MKTLIRIVVACLLSQAIFAQGNTWTRKADFSGKQFYGATGFAIGNKGYVGTGFDENGYTTGFWEYDQTTNTWAQKANFAGTARADATGFSIGNKGYIGTGENGDEWPATFRDFWEYDPAANIWTRKSDIPGYRGRYAAVGFTIGEKGYLGTGAFYDGEHDPFCYTDFWEYDPATNAWTQKADFGGGARRYAAGFALGNKGYLGTGNYFDRYGTFYPNYKDFWEYDPSTNSWTQKADFAGGGRYKSVGLAITNKGYFGMGNNSPNYYTDFWEYDIVTNKWAQKTDFGEPGAVSFSIADKGYLGTGAGREFWEYSPGTVCAPPANLNVTKIADSSVRVTWTSTGAVENGYLVRYYPVGSTSWKERLAKPTAVQLLLKNLQPGTTYKWKMRSVCPNAASGWIKGPDFTTAASFVVVPGAAKNDKIASAGNTLMISPNPNKGNFNLQLQLPVKASFTTLLLYNNFGQLVWQQNLGNIAGAIEKNITLQNKLSDGFYTLTVQRSDLKMNRKIVIAR